MVQTAKVRVQPSSFFIRLLSQSIPVPNVDGKTLLNVIEYCKAHTEAAAAAEGPPQKPDSGDDREDAVKAFDAEFVKVEQGTLFDLVKAANYLNVKSLLDLTCQAVANMIKGKTPDEIRNMFGIACVFTPEEEEEVRRENSWAFE